MLRFINTPFLPLKGEAHSTNWQYLVTATTLTHPLEGRVAKLSPTGFSAAREGVTFLAQHSQTERLNG